MIYFWQDDKLSFLSNFYLQEISIAGITYASVEHYYQSQKTNDPVLIQKIITAPTPGKAKRLGGKINTTPSWEHEKVSVMIKALREKFKNPVLQEKLLSLQGEIIEDSPRDFFWGTGEEKGRGTGLNMLGKCLMLIRSYYKKELIFPLNNYSKILPLNNESSFAHIRKHDVHTGIDLHTEEGSGVFSIAKGRVIKVINFTGPKANSPWWEDTEAVLVEHSFGVVLYGELSPKVKEGDELLMGQEIGIVKRVLKTNKGKPQSMLHLEYYNQKVDDGVIWPLNEDLPKGLLNPYEILILSQ